MNYSLRLVEIFNDSRQLIASNGGSHHTEADSSKTVVELPGLNLPTDYSRSGTTTRHHAAYTFHFPTQVLTHVEAVLGKDPHAHQALLLTLYLILLYRYTNQEEIGVGIVTAQGRIWGVSTAFLPQLTGHRLLGQVHTALQQANAVAPFPAAQRHTAPVTLERLPFAAVQVLFLHNLPATVASVQAKLAADVDLALLIEPGETVCSATLLYQTKLFLPSTITRMAGHLQALSMVLVADPDQPVARLPLLTEAESRQLLIEWNQTAAPYPDQACIHHLLEQQVARTPDAVAVRFGTQQLTYRALDERANQLAHHLCKLGVKPGDLVGIYLERSLEMIVGLLGVLKAGGAYVPLDPHFPAERLTFMLEDATAQVILTSASLLAQLQPIIPVGQTCHLICLDSLPTPWAGAPLPSAVTDWTIIAQEETAPLRIAVQPEHLAYCIYTSGSTGKPKGVEIEHRAVVNFLTTMRQAPGLTAQDVLLAVTTISFDIAGLELYLPLLVGAQIILTTRTIAASGHLLAHLIQDVGATVMQATPATWHLLLAAGWQGQPGLKILCGGEALSQALASQLLTKGATLWNLYGPTETTIWSTAYQVKQRQRATNGAAVNQPAPHRGRDLPESIGRPIANTQIYILNTYGQPVPIGVPGDLYIGGAGLARGYRNRPDLTAERFIPNPFGAGRLYKTGDIARYLPDGNLDFLGRSDHQVKIRGFRIELGEIETTLMRHPLVREVVVVAHQGENDAEDKRLVAYLVLAPSTIATTQPPAPVETDFRTYLAEHLPEYMIPGYFIVLPAMPLTPNGKINRLALPAPTAQRPTLLTHFVVPQTKIEQLIAKTWQETLRLTSVGIHDNFFELGGNSLLLTQAYTKLLQEDSLQGHFSAELSTTTLLEYPTIYKLAQFLSQRANTAPNHAQAVLAAQEEGKSLEKQSDRRRRRTELVEQRGQRTRR